MLSRHGFSLIPRSLSRYSIRTFTSAPTLWLPRKRLEGDSVPAPKLQKAALKLQKARSKNDSPQKKDAATPKLTPKPKPVLGLLEQQARLEKALKRRTSQAKGKATSGLKAIIRSSDEHHDLQSFLEFAERKKLDQETAVYKGTHYEYVVMEALKPFGFHLERIGKSNDKGLTRSEYSFSARSAAACHRQSASLRVPMRAHLVGGPGTMCLRSCRAAKP
jgi:hypothetical protein